MKYLFVLMASALLASPLMGCGASLLSDRATDPITIDFQSNPGPGTRPGYGIIATTAGRRVIFLFHGTATVNGTAGRSVVCAEPPPDAVDSFTNALSLTGKGGPSGAVNVDISRQLAVSSGLATRRSQGLQWARDQSFYACIDLANNLITPDQYRAKMDTIQQEAIGLITTEVNLWGSATAPTPVVSAPSQGEPEASKNQKNAQGGSGTNKTQGGTQRSSARSGSTNSQSSSQ